MDYAPAVGELQAPAYGKGDVDCLFQRDAVVVGGFQHPFHVSTAHQLGDHVGSAVLLSQVEDGDYVRVGTQPAHGLGFPGDALAARVVQALCLYQSEGDVAVERRVVGEVDPLLAAFSEELLDLVAAAVEGGG